MGNREQYDAEEDYAEDYGEDLGTVGTIGLFVALVFCLWMIVFVLGALGEVHFNDWTCGFRRCS